MMLQQLIPIAITVAVPNPRNCIPLLPHPTASKCTCTPLLVCRRPHTLSSALGNNCGGYPSDDDDDTCSSSGGGAKEEIEEVTAKAIDAVCEILHEYVGFSREESLDIGSNSPNYIKMLVDAVHDLEWANNSSKDDCMKRVYEMALKKDEKGMVPFLEYLGLSLPTAMYLARSHHLSSHTLLLLLPKVKYMKVIFFSAGCDDGAVIGQKASHMMMHLSIRVDEDVQHTLSFLDKIQVRHGRLDLLGSGDVTFRYLIESFPHLLSLPIESRVKPMLKFFEDTGVSEACMRSVLLLVPLIIFYDIEKDVKPRLQALKKVNGVGKEFGKMLVKYLWIFSTSIQKNYVEVHSYFHKEKVAEDSIQRALKDGRLFWVAQLASLNSWLSDFGTSVLTTRGWVK